MTGTPRKPDKAGERKDSDERDLDEALEELFPASDPPAVSRTSSGAPDHPEPQARNAGRDRAAETK